MKNPVYSVGIDCGEHTGVSIFNRVSQKLLSVHTTDFFGVTAILNAIDDSLIVYVEVPPDFMYSRNRNESGKVRDKHLINIGGNRREAQLLAKYLQRLGYDVQEVPPVRETKWTAEQFQRFMKTDIKSNQHERDAARLAYIYAGKASVAVR